MEESTPQSKQLNLVALLAFIVGLGLALVDLYVVDVSSSPDSPLVGLLLALLPALTAILWVYPTVSWLYARGVKWPGETGDIRNDIAALRRDIAELRQQLGDRSRPPE